MLLKLKKLPSKRNLKPRPLLESREEKKKNKDREMRKLERKKSKIRLPLKRRRPMKKKPNL
jgi:hypothetical protein